MRISEGSYRRADLRHGVGYYHRCSSIASRPLVNYSTAPQAPPRAFEMDFDSILRRWGAQTQPWELDDLACELGVSWGSLVRLGVVRRLGKTAWAFPMHDDRRRVVGIRLRSPAGQKFALGGSHAGAFIPSGLDSRSTLLICEGPTDTAAALTLGFNAIGRPSCSGAVNIISDMLRVGRRRNVVIVADADEPDKDGRRPGIDGAEHLASCIVDLTLEVRVNICEPYKDLRAWLNAGCTPAAADARVMASNPYRKTTDGLDQGGKTDAAKA